MSKLSYGNNVRKIPLVGLFVDKYWRNRPMVSYWKTADAVEAKLFKDKDGVMRMQMKGEKYVFPGYPRGVLLFGKLSKLKHEIKNQIFNETWAMLEEKRSDDEINAHLGKAWANIFAISATMTYDFVPYEKLVPPVKELHRAMTVTGCDTRIRDVLCFIFQEDDAYRMRFQWLTKFFPGWSKPTGLNFYESLCQLENAEVVGDMKERVRLVRRVFTFIVKDSETYKTFLKEVDWKKVALSEADKYFFRAKYFKVDYPQYQY